MPVKRKAANVQFNINSIFDYFHLHKTKFVILIAIIAALLVGNVLVKKPQIAIIEIKDKISDDYADNLTKMISHAYLNEDIKAVVLDVSSPGGEASAVEGVYLSLLELRKKKPVVAAVSGIAASGAYYDSVAANYIFSTPSATIGSVGVVSVLPKPEKLSDDTIVSGPFKKVGSTAKKFTYELKAVQEGFLNAVMAQRKNKLKLSKAELSEARTYLANEALQQGMIDAIGSELDAINKAASYAGIANYDVIKLNEKLSIRAVITINPLSIDQNIFTNNTNTVPKYYYIYVAQE